MEKEKPSRGVKDCEDYRDLLQAAKRGKKIPERTLSRIESDLREKRCSSCDPYTMIHLLGVARFFSARDTIRQYLSFGIEDPENEDAAMVRRIAFQMLGDKLEDVAVFDIALKSAFADPSVFVRQVCARLIGSVGRQVPDRRKDVAAALLRGLDRSRDVDQELWESFHEGLVEFFNEPVDLLRGGVEPLSNEDARWDLVKKAREMLGS